jgi:hypothetical protein
MLCCASKSRTNYFTTGVLGVPFLISDYYVIFLCSSIYSQIAKNAMSLVERFDVPAQIPELYLNFYGRIAWRFEPFQAGIGNLRHSFEAGLSYGNNDMGMHCGIHVIKYLLFSGANLRSILKEIDYYLRLLETYKSEMARNFLLTWRETVSMLIDNGQATSIQAKACLGDLEDPGNKMREAFFHHSAIRCFWLGHTERCRYYSEKCLNLFGQGSQPIAYIAKFYIGKFVVIVKLCSPQQSAEEVNLTSIPCFFSLVSSLLRNELALSTEEEQVC